jgi:2-polyprenyl-3-methyl-5-hydroxy-6-metoxy-1,4-benzoquinol methylase
VNTERRLSAKHVWEKAYEFLGDIKDLHVLDIPAGNGQLAAFLCGKGAVVTAADINPVNLPNGVKVDMNEILCFASNSFDAVLCLEGIEHIENQARLIRELYRILKPQGKIIVSTPNITNIRSRMKFLLKGSFFWFDQFATIKYGHINPILPIHLFYFMKTAGFKTLEYSFNTAPLGKRWKITANNSSQLSLFFGEILIVKAIK